MSRGGGGGGSRRISFTVPITEEAGTLISDSQFNEEDDFDENILKEDPTNIDKIFKSLKSYGNYQVKTEFVKH